MATFRIEIDVPPGRFRVNKAWRAGKNWGGKPQVHLGDTYSTAKARLGEKAHLTLLRDFEGKPFGGPLCVSVFLYMPKKHQKGPAKRLGLGDIDGPLKGILDALESAGIFKNDAQVAHLEVMKFLDPESPRVVVEVSHAKRHVGENPER